MYTQCPECSAAFRVTANDLKQAAGKVRCGGCGRAFDALEFLSEEMPVGNADMEPGPKLPELKPDVPGKRRPPTISPEDSIALLKTLDQLAGSDIRLEDTGIEWRVLDDQVLAALETEDAQPTSGIDLAETDVLEGGERRYDDDTPMDTEPQAIESGPDVTAMDPTDEIPVMGGEPDIEFDDDETGEWEEILEEVDDRDVADEEEPADEDGHADPLTEVIVQEGVGEDDAHDEEGEVPDSDATTGDEETGTAHADGDGEPRDDEVEAAEKTPHAEASEEPQSAEGEDRSPGDDGETDDAEHSESSDEVRADEDDDNRASADDDSGTSANDAPDEEPSPEVQDEEVEVESIILEGDTVRSALEEEDEDAPIELSAAWTPPGESATAHARTGSRFGMSVAAVLLLAILGLQAVHQNRAKLATIPELRDLIAPVYRAAGMPLVPTWDVRGWRFEATQGSSDTEADQLIVYSRLGNTSEEPLPYPLIGVSLTDRFEETVGGALLEPVEYLADNRNPRDPIAPGDSFDAVITLESPDPAATGYRLRACYRAVRGKLRCAVGDFKQ